MGILTDVHQTNNQSVTIKNPVVIKATKKGGVIVCPACSGRGKEEYPDYGTYENCSRCNGGGAIEVVVK